MWVSLHSNRVGSHISLRPAQDSHVVAENASQVFGDLAAVVKGFVGDITDFVCSLERGRVCGLGDRRKRIKKDVAKLGPMKRISLSTPCCSLNGGYIM